MSDPPKRPGLIWVITVGYALVFALMAWVGGFLFSHWETLPERLRAPLREVSLPLWAAMTVGCALTVIAIVQLFRMRRSAFYLYAVGVAGTVAVSLPLYVTGRYHGYQLFGLLTQLLVCLYMWRLLRANVLR
jgi:hypothetical protein